MKFKSIFPEDNLTDQQWNSLQLKGSDIYIKYNMIANDLKNYSMNLEEFNKKLDILKGIIDYKSVTLRKISKCKHKKNGNILVNLGDDFIININNLEIIFKKNSMIILNHKWEIKNSKKVINNKEFKKGLKIFLNYKV